MIKLLVRKNVIKKTPIYQKEYKYRFTLDEISFNRKIVLLKPRSGKFYRMKMMADNDCSFTLKDYSRYGAKRSNLKYMSIKRMNLYYRTTPIMMYFTDMIYNENMVYDNDVIEDTEDNW